MTTITVCMGSSCFSRGNAHNAETIQQYLKIHNLEGNVVFKGCLCQGVCKNGPHILINNKEFSNVTPEALELILAQELRETE